MGKGSVGNRYGQQLRKENRQDVKTAEELKLGLFLFGLEKVDTYVFSKTQKLKTKKF